MCIKIDYHIVYNLLINKWQSKEIAHTLIPFKSIPAIRRSSFYFLGAILFNINALDY